MITGEYRQVNTRDVNSVWTQNAVHKVIDLQTQIQYNVRGQANSKRHIDYQTVTADDTRTMLGIFGSWSWNGRPIVFCGPRNVWVPASIHCMPHAEPVSNHDHDNQFIVPPGNIVGPNWASGSGRRGHACIWLHDSHATGSGTSSVNNTDYARSMRREATRAHEIAEKIRGCDDEVRYRTVNDIPAGWLRDTTQRLVNEGVISGKGADTNTGTRIVDVTEDMIRGIVFNENLLRVRGLVK